MKTSKMVLMGLVALALVALAAPSFAEGASADATLVTAIAISKTTDLDFGGVVAGGSGTAVITATEAGARTGSTHTMLVTALPGHSAVFAVTGTGSNTFAVTLTQPALNVIKTGVAASDETNTIGVVLVNGAETGTLTGGTKDIYVGGTLTVVAGNIAGQYTGTFDVAVAYN